MQIIISSRHFKVFKYVKQDIKYSLEKFNKPEWKINKIEVVLNRVHNKFHVEVLIKGKGIFLESKAEEEQLTDAYIQAYNKSWRQIKKLMSKRTKHQALHIAEIEMMAIEEAAKNDEFEVSA